MNGLEKLIETHALSSFGGEICTTSGMLDYDVKTKSTHFPDVSKQSLIVFC